MATPQYRVLMDAFIAPHLIRAGSVIETTMTPGNHLQAMNAEAKAALDTWYHQEFEDKDEKGKLTGKTIKPHLMYAPPDVSSAPIETVGFSLVSAPPRVLDSDIENSLGVAQLKPATEFKLPPPVLGPVSENLTIIEAAPAKKD